ncbi:TPA: DNA-directed RNA polymerase subunit alpha [Candidatus Sumerlaeota bacterium]|jgi:DNA-directed RNA polymerase subunit alpha|nr:DNA-directed RNA polymerase subunit alpha [Candidatus Sumerlaeota bacterium]
MDFNFKPLIMPHLLQEPETGAAEFARFTAEPLERGFGATLGNSLRRVLLSSIQGSAITAIRIKGVAHEYETIPGCKEDISDIILNLKQIRIRLADGVNEANVLLESDGPGDVSAAAFQTVEGVEILNPEQHIATMGNGSLVMEIHVARGRGYVPAHKEIDEEDEIGIIPIDSAFSPILNVRYYVENARVGQRTDYDRLVLEVTTDGTVAPHEAVSCSARILRDHLTMFIMAEHEQAVLAQEAEARSSESHPFAELEEKLGRSIEELELSVRSFNCLEAAGIKTIRDLVQKSEAEMLKYRNFGRKSLFEIKNILKEMGLTFNMKIGDDGLPVFPKEKKD